MISLLRNIDLKLAPKKPNQNLSKNSILIKKKKGNGTCRLWNHTSITIMPSHYEIVVVNMTTVSKHNGHVFLPLSLI